MFAGLSIMVPSVQRVPGWRTVKSALLFAVFLLLCAHVYAPTKARNISTTNEKIQELAGLATARAADTPIGSGDLIHVEVFEVPELSRDLRVSETGEITYPLIPGKISASRPDRRPTRTEIGETSDRKRFGLSSASLRFRKGTEQPAGFIWWAPYKSLWFTNYPAHHVTGIAGAGRRRY